MAMWTRGILAGLFIATSGCSLQCLNHLHRTHVTAVPLSPQIQCAPEGIPYYLPKPLLVIAKNVRHIDDSKVGLTSPAPIPNAFDDQSSYGSIKANVTVPGSQSKAAQTDTGGTSLPTKFGESRSKVEGIEEIMTPPANAQLGDELAPDSFFTYQIVFVPDLSQKYALQVKGGPGEIRAAMNLVNGWMYTGMGPYYMKDSSTAQNIMAAGVGAMYTGRAVADVVNGVGDIAKVAGGASEERAPAEAGEVLEKYTHLARLLQSETVVPHKMLNYAEIYIYEPTLMEDGTMSWNLIAEHHFDRDYFQPTMGPEALKVFQSILQQDTERTLERAKVERQERSERAKLEQEERLERARIERGSAGGDKSNGASDGLPDVNSRVATPQPPMSVSSITDQAIDHNERQMLGLPSVTTSPISPNEINVNVTPQSTEHPGVLSRFFGHFKKHAPKLETRTQRVVEVSPFGQGPTSGTVGGSITSSGTIPGAPQ